VDSVERQPGPVGAIEADSAEVDPKRVRGRVAARLARSLCWVWFIPLGCLAAVIAYISLVFNSMVLVEGLEQPLTFGLVAASVGVPVALLAVTAAAGVTLASAVARLLAGVWAVRRWIAGGAGALVGGAAALGAFWLVLTSG